MLKALRKALCFTLIISFVSTSLYLPQAQAQSATASSTAWQPNEQGILPEPGTMVTLSPAYAPAYLKGIVIHPDDPFKFDFIVYKGDGHLDADQKNSEYNKLIKYFLASLTVPDQDQWVNLSPYEKNRIIEADFGKTEMGRDLLAQDYLLKQITSSLMYPESGLGKEFWNRVYARAAKEFGTTDIPVNTFNKVWIVPDQARIDETNNTAYITRSHLKVMLEEDYLAIEKNNRQPGDMYPAGYVSPSTLPSGLGVNVKALQGNYRSTSELSSQIIREIIIPELTKEVNEGKNFAMLRQVFSGMILAAWYKKALKESILGRIYTDRSRTKGTLLSPNVEDPQHIYQQYLKAFKKGVFNYVKDTVLPDGSSVPRKYFAGGFWNNTSHITLYRSVSDDAMAADLNIEGSKVEDAVVKIEPAADSAQASRVAPTTQEIFNDPPVLGRYLRSAQSTLELGEFVDNILRAVSRRDSEKFLRMLDMDQVFPAAEGSPASDRFSPWRQEVMREEMEKMIAFTQEKAAASGANSKNSIDQLIGGPDSQHGSVEMPPVPTIMEMPSTLGYYLRSAKDDEELKVFVNRAASAMKAFIERSENPHYQQDWMLDNVLRVGFIFPADAYFPLSQTKSLDPLRDKARMQQAVENLFNKVNTVIINNEKLDRHVNTASVARVTFTLVVIIMLMFFVRHVYKDLILPPPDHITNIQNDKAMASETHKVPGTYPVDIPQNLNDIIELMDKDGSYTRMSRVVPFDFQVGSLTGLSDLSRETMDALALRVPVDKLPRYIKDAFKKLQVELYPGVKIDFFDIMKEYFRDGIIFTPYIQQFNEQDKVSPNQLPYLILNENQAKACGASEGTLVMPLPDHNTEEDVLYVDKIVRASIISLMRYQVTRNGMVLEQRIKDKDKFWSKVEIWAVKFLMVNGYNNIKDSKFHRFKGYLEKNPKLFDDNIEDFISRFKGDFAMVTDRVKLTNDPGGIDMNAAHMDLLIKRDGRGVVLPVSQQDMDQLNRIEGFVPVIIEIRPVSSLWDTKQANILHPS